LSAVSVASLFTSVCNLREGVRAGKLEGNIVNTYLVYHCLSGIYVWDNKYVAVL